jgi:type IV pilus assembly protein PilY1
MSRTHRTARRIAASLFVPPFLGVCVLLVSAGRTGADDTDLFTTRVAPNVVFVFDNSLSMNHIVWHPTFRTDFVYDATTCPSGYVPGDATCTERYLAYPLCAFNSNLESGTDTDILGSDGAWAAAEGYQTLNGGTGLSRCSNTRDIFVDPEVLADANQTIWSEKYLEWYFSDNVEVDHDSDGTTILQEIVATGNGSNSACLVNDGYPATYDRYRRARVTAAKNITLDVICQTSSVADLRYGLAKFFVRTGFADPDGGWVAVPVADYSSTQAAALEGAIEAVEGEALTPLAETLYNVYRYFMLRGTNEQPFGKNGSTRFPAYDLRTSDGSVSTPVAGSPVTSECQKHFVVIITDGEPTWDDFDDETSPDRLAPGKTTWRDSLIGDYYMPGDETEELGNSREEAKYLDDVAHFMHQNDFLPTAAYPGTQVLDIYTVGFTTNSVANDILSRAAERGGGDFYTSNNPEELAEAITDAISSIVAKAKSFTSAAVPASRTTDGDNFYSAYFVPDEDTPFWEGHLKDFDFTSAGDVLTAGGNCAVGVDPNATPPCDTLGALRTTAEGFWDAGTAMPDPGDRKLYVEIGSTSIFSMPTAFTMPADPQDAVDAFGIVDNVDENDPPYDTLSPNDPEDIAAAIIDTLRGCEFGVSPCDPRVDANGDPQYLGDVFHSNPVVIGSPNAAINETSYKSFATTYHERTRVIYAGSNSGFLHGFNAGDWDGTLSPPRHDRGTGEELFGFMPYAVRNVVKDLLKQQSGLRTMVTVDGSPSVADVWFYRNTSGGNLTTVDPVITAKQAAQWRTVLIQGLREGGEQYFALDVTDPTASAADTTTTYPRYLWGFPCEDCANAVNPDTASEATYLGATWSDPIITRVKVKAENGVAGKGYERWVAIFGGGYHEHGDPNGPDYRVPADVGFTPKGRAIYMVDITTGEVLAKKVFDDSAVSLALATGEQVGIKEMRYAIASSPAVYDLDFDGFADVIYIGDLGGNLWKWVIHALGDDPINNASSDDDMAQPNWPFRLFFRAGTSLEPVLPPEQLGLVYDDTVHYQSFFYPPTGTLRQGKLVLAFGAGERANPIVPAAEYGDGDPDNNNHYYVVKDDDPLEEVGSLPNALTDALDEADLTDIDQPSPPTCAQMQATSSGYFITARDAEAFVSNSLIFLGTVFTGSFLQSDPASLGCEGAGSAVIYSFDLDCGVGAFPTTPGSDADDRRTVIGTGIPTRPRVSVGDLNQGGGGGGGGGGPCPNRVVIVTSDGEILNDCPGDIDSTGIGIRSWRER